MEMICSAYEELGTAVVIETPFESALVAARLAICFAIVVSCRDSKAQDLSENISNPVRKAILNSDLRVDLGLGLSNLPDNGMIH
jgi:hypothetical protein